MLHEVAASALDPSDIVSPLRQMFRRVQLLEAEVQHIDLPTRRVVVSYGPSQRLRDLECDHLVIATGSEDNFFGNAELAARAQTMKTLTDAMLLRNRVIALLEEGKATKAGTADAVATTDVRPVAPHSTALRIAANADDKAP